MRLLKDGQTIRDTCEVERFLGKDAFAGVYCVKHRFLRRQAMKVFKSVGMNPDEIMAQYAGLEWRGTGFWPGTELASRCTAPEQQRRYRRLHVQITWRDSYGEPVKVPGPICIRGGKFFGLGLFAPITICT